MRAMLRPGVVWFGEGLPPQAWERAVEAASSCDVFLVVGTSALVYPAAGLIDVARRAKVIEVNVEATAYSAQVDAALRGPASLILPELVSGGQ